MLFIQLQTIISYNRIFKTHINNSHELNLVMNLYSHEFIYHAMRFSWALCPVFNVHCALITRCKFVERLTMSENLVAT